MKKFSKVMASAATAAMVAGSLTVANAADSVNVAFFLEWATPNQTLTRL